MIKSINDNFINLVCSTIKNEESLWKLGNDVLYDLCEKNFGHKKEDEILAKIWLIGRAYAATIERRNTDNETEEQKRDFWHNYIKKIQESNIDEYFSNLKNKKEKTEDDIFITYFELLKAFHSFVHMNKISLTSKYLHFHFRDEYYIYDSKAAFSINKLIKYLKISKSEYNVDEKWNDAHFILKEPDEEKEQSRFRDYVLFYQKCKICKNKIKETYNYDLTPRELDHLLLAIKDNPDFQFINVLK